MNDPEQLTQKSCGCQVKIDKETIKILECDMHNWKVSTRKWQKTEQKK